LPKWLREILPCPVHQGREPPDEIILGLRIAAIPDHFQYKCSHSSVPGPGAIRPGNDRFRQIVQKPLLLYQELPAGMFVKLVDLYSPKTEGCPSYDKTKPSDSASTFHPSGFNCKFTTLPVFFLKKSGIP